MSALALSCSSSEMLIMPLVSLVGMLGDSESGELPAMVGFSFFQYKVYYSTEDFGKKSAILTVKHTPK